MTSDTTRLISNHPQSHDLSMHSPIGHLDGLFNHCYISYQFDMWSFLFLPWTLMPKQVPWQKKTEKLAIIIIRPFFVVPVAWTARKFGIQSVGRWRRYEHLLYDDWSWGTRGNLCMFFFKTAYPGSALKLSIFTQLKSHTSTTVMFTQLLHSL